MTLTKRELVVRIGEDLEELRKETEAKEAREQEPRKGRRRGRERNQHGRVTQQQVLFVLQKALDYIAEALARRDKVELRNFGVFEVKVRKARIGRNPNAPDLDVPIPARSVVRFKAGKEMRAEVLRLPPPTKGPRPNKAQG
jgi:nucleoid DNA-binding protein